MKWQLLPHENLGAHINLLKGKLHPFMVPGRWYLGDRITWNLRNRYENHKITCHDSKQRLLHNLWVTWVFTGAIFLGISYLIGRCGCIRLNSFIHVHSVIWMTDLQGWHYGAIVHDGGAVVVARWELITYYYSRSLFRLIGSYTTMHYRGWSYCARWHATAVRKPSVRNSESELCGGDSIFG